MKYFLSIWQEIEDEPVLPPLKAIQEVAQDIWNQWKQELAIVKPITDVIKVKPGSTHTVTIEVQNMTGNKWLEKWPNLHLTVIDKSDNILKFTWIDLKKTPHLDEQWCNVSFDLELKDDAAQGDHQIWLTFD